MKLMAKPSQLDSVGEVLDEVSGELAVTGATAMDDVVVDVVEVVGEGFQP